jgi:uncharacterized repeat protein (TIGR01451 family)
MKSIYMKKARQSLGPCAKAKKPRVLASLPLLAALGLAVAAAGAWGPDRKVFTMEAPAEQVTFNSISNNPVYGDERNFVVASEKGASSWADGVPAERGKEYLIRLFVHNSALEKQEFKALDVTASVELPENFAKTIEVKGTVQASNANPAQVWDSAFFESAEPFKLEYVPGSARYYNSAFGADGAAVADSVVTAQGAPLGYSALDGVMPGGSKYSGTLLLTVRPVYPSESSIQLDMSARLDGDGTDNWRKKVQAALGDVINFQIHFTNTTDIVKKQVIIKNSLPEGLSYVEGSTTLVNGGNLAGISVNDDVASASGLNIGDYEPGANAYVRFSAKVDNNVDLFRENVTLTNYGRVSNSDPGQEPEERSVEIEVRVEMLVDVTARLNGETGTESWRKNVNASPGDIVNFQVLFKNSTGAVREDIVIKNTLPDGLAYIADSTLLYNGSNPDGLKSIDGVTSGTGINIGDYGSGANAYLRFSAQVDENFEAGAGVKLTNYSQAGTADQSVKPVETFVEILVRKAPQPVSPAAVPVTVDGKSVSLGMYNIDGYNLCKLRDLAFVLDGSAKQFDVGWDSGVITLTSGKAYTAVGGEGQAGDAEAKTPAYAENKILLDGGEKEFTSYNIGGYTYFKLRDLAMAFNFYLGWDDAAKALTIDTANGFAE